MDKTNLLIYCDMLEDTCIDTNMLRRILYIFNTNESYLDICNGDNYGCGDSDTLLNGDGLGDSSIFGGCGDGDYDGNGTGDGESGYANGNGMGTEIEWYAME